MMELECKKSYCTVCSGVKINTADTCSPKPSECEPDVACCKCVESCPQPSLLLIYTN